MIDLPADRTGPGRSVQRGRAQMVVPSGKNGADFIKLFAATNFELAQTDDFTSVVWRKLCLNSAGAVSAVVLKGAGISRHDGVAELMRNIVRECIAVGRAEGATLADTVPDEIVAGARRAPRGPADGNRCAKRGDRAPREEARHRDTDECADGGAARSRAGILTDS